MATSVITAASSADHHHHRRAASPGPHEHGRRGAAPPRRGPGRRKGRSGEGGPRRRGMGVEKLEKLMRQDPWRKAAEAGQFPDPVSDTAGYGSPAGFKYGGGSDPIGSGAPGCCYSEQCTVCHKKKKFNGGNYGFLGVNSDEAHEGLNIGTKMALGTGFANSGKQQGHVEIVAVHRKGCSMSSPVMMEYEFFPSKSDHSSQNAELPMKMKYPSSGQTPSDYVDLSLKLSY